MHKPITHVAFQKAVGRKPQQDDLERCNCGLVGELGHWSCGWCAECDLPRFLCGQVSAMGTV
jgi:hypothetical protein